MCPPPRKSLVKGERFIRSEGRPELTFSRFGQALYTDKTVEAIVGSPVSTTIIIFIGLWQEVASIL